VVSVRDHCTLFTCDVVCALKREDTALLFTKLCPYNVTEDITVTVSNTYFILL
jgi:hypothetical protein